ncbi:MAG: FtsH protease activity modulator HflK [Deltaproteobacteria bacterium]
MDQFRPRDEQYGVREIQRGIDDLKDFMDRYLRGRGYWFVILIVIILYLISGFYIVGPGQKGVVLLFGKVWALTEPGLRYRLPWPFMSRTVVDVAKLRREEIGYRSDRGRTRSVPAESLMLTADENIVDVHFFVQYRVNDPVKFLFGCLHPVRALRASAEVALRSVVGQNDIDHTMITGRAEVQRDVAKYLQNLLNNYDTGLKVVQARLLSVDPPAQVQEAFHDVVRALEDKQRLKREAEGYMADVLPKARGQKQQEILRAEGYKAQRVIRATGDVARFKKILTEYDKAPRVTRERIYLEAVEQFLPKTRKFVMEGNSSRVLPLLPLMGYEKPGSIPVPAKSQPKAPARKKGN